MYFKVKFCLIFIIYFNGVNHFSRGWYFMDSYMYDMIFKRKSFHLFRNVNVEHISDDELDEIYKKFLTFKPLIGDIKVKIKIEKDSGSCKRGQEYCILFYSEKKDNYLENIGYLGEQLDLYLVSKNIGTLWFGIGKASEKVYEGLEFVIMMAITKIGSPDKFRKDMFKSKRKDVSEIWSGNNYIDIANIVRFAPSACNTQPWMVEASSEEIRVYRYKKEGKRGIMPKEKVIYYNQIDIGIFLCFMEICFEKCKIMYTRQLFSTDGSFEEKKLTAIYRIN